MISFANILFRDIGKDEVVDYGKYGIVFDRDFITKEFDLNPVFYIKGENEIEKTFKNNFENSFIPQILDIVKAFHTKNNGKNFNDYIEIDPMSREIKGLVKSLDKNVNDEFIKSIKTVFESYFNNSLKQGLLLKPFKVINKDGEEKVAYNEREWRKSFFDSFYISENTPNGDLNKEYVKWISKEKPHFTDKYVLKFRLSDVKCIYVDNESEVHDLQMFIKKKFKNQSIDINTLKEYKKRESKS